MKREGLIRIFFVDIDGPLNTVRFITFQANSNNNEYEVDGHTYNDNFDPQAMLNLKEMVEEFDAYIVLTSSRRPTLDNEIRLEMDAKLNETDEWIFIYKEFERYGLKDRLIGVTHGYIYKNGKDVPRYIEINKWINNHPQYEIEWYIAIDDDSFDYGFLIPFLVKVNNYDGFNNEAKEKAREKILSLVNNKT